VERRSLSAGRAAAAEKYPASPAPVILLWALVLSVIVALVRGGKFSRLGEVTFRYGWLALVALALQVMVIYFPLPMAEGFLGKHTLLLLSSYALLIVVAVLNRSIPGLPLVGLGLALNLLVVLANGGFMPVTLEALRQAGLAQLALGLEPGSRLVATKDIILPRHDTRLWILSDIFVIPPPLPINTIFSLGDFFLAFGAFVFFQRAMLPADPACRVGKQGAK
jgi:hypothetical protein